MKKLVKTITYAKAYEQWYALESLRDYNSSANKYYHDVLYELLILQDGLCAYTEYRLASVEDIETIKLGFVEGKLTLKDKPDIPADLEHFDKSKKGGNGWHWDNFFAVDKFVNLKKNHLEDVHGIDEILRPDCPDFEASHILKYDRSSHTFKANDLTLNARDQDRVEKMLIVLGVNNDFIKMKRREFLEEALDRMEFLPHTVNIHQFPTAFSMLTKSMA